MAWYLGRYTVSQDYIKAMIANPQDRTAAIGQLAEAIGGKIHHVFFAFGDYDVVMLFEAPGNSAAVSAALVAASAGSITSANTTPLLTMDETVAAMRTAGAAAGAYKPPGS